MNPRERGFLLLTSCLGDPNRKPLTTAQLRVLADRAWQLDTAKAEQELTAEDLISLGYGRVMAERIVRLLSQEDVLDHYLSRAKRSGCEALARVSPGYPLRLRKTLGLDSPGCLWSRGNIEILNSPMIALVGSRDLNEENRRFAYEAGRQAALQGYTLVSGNARGADRTAQDSCLAHGGRVVSVVADALTEHQERDRILYLSEEDFDAPFSAQRALSRNRCVHALGSRTLVAQCSLGSGGTWDGTVKNLRFNWSGVFCFRDGSPASRQLAQMGATLVDTGELSDLSRLDSQNQTFFDQ